MTTPNTTPSDPTLALLSLVRNNNIEQYFDAWKHCQTDAEREPVLRQALAPIVSEVHRLIDAGANVHAPSTGGYGMLHHAVAGGLFPVVEALVERGANTYIRPKDGKDFNTIYLEHNAMGERPAFISKVITGTLGDALPRRWAYCDQHIEEKVPLAEAKLWLFYAAIGNHYDKLEALLTQGFTDHKGALHTFSAHEKNNGHSLLYFAVSGAPDTRIVQLLLSHGVKPDAEVMPALLKRTTDKTLPTVLEITNLLRAQGAEVPGNAETILSGIRDRDLSPENKQKLLGALKPPAPEVNGNGHATAVAAPQPAAALTPGST